jgi:hypothetical protein
MGDGYGGIGTFSPSGKSLVMIGATPKGEGALSTFSTEGTEIIRLSATSDENGNGTLSTLALCLIEYPMKITLQPSFDGCINTGGCSETS